MELIDKSIVVAKIEELDEFWHLSKSPDGQAFIESLLSFLDVSEVKEVDLKKEEEKLNKVIELADAMYYAAQQLTTDASRLRKAMRDWWHFKNFNL